MNLPIPFPLSSTLSFVGAVISSGIAYISPEPFHATSDEEAAFFMVVNATRIAGEQELPFDENDMSVEIAGRPAIFVGPPEQS